MEVNSRGNEDKRANDIARRKLSIPTLLTVPHGPEQAAFKRRFSNVGEAARKLSTSMGWRTAGGPAPEEIVAVGRAMCSLYLRTRLKRAGVFNRKFTLTRVRSAVGTMEGCSNTVRDVFPGLATACTELERLYPKLYVRVSRQAGRTPENGIAGVLLAVGHYLFRAEPSWGKVVAIYSVAGGLAVDVVRQGRHEGLHVIMEDITELLEERVAMWVHTNGGWGGLITHCKQQDKDIPLAEYLTTFGLVAVVLLVAYFLVKFCSKLG